VHEKSGKPGVHDSADVREHWRVGPEWREGGSGASGVELPSDYVIGADDTLHISVWKEPDLTATLPVRPDGKISLPLLNDLPAAGLTPMQLAASITEKLRKYIADPRVTVVVAAMNSRRVFVTGEVVHPGAMALLPHMTMLQAISSAGFTHSPTRSGFTYCAWRMASR
jgi:protein involved in polysaccharide export with SLBB domain